MDPSAAVMTTPARPPRRLLIVEDERIVALDLQVTLEGLGYIVVGTAASSEDALQQVAHHRPDLVLMDIRIGGARDGIQTAAVLRERYQLSVVYLTANADAATLDRALETGPSGYLVKPYDHRTLRTTIEVALHRHEADRAAHRAHDAEKTRHYQQVVEFARIAERFRQDATTDPLTGLYNRRHFDFVMKRELSLGGRESHSVGLIILDLDRFKDLNDTYGHLAGDSVLRAIAEFLRARLRVYDIPCRYGGEEIAIILPGGRTRDALALAEQLRAGIEQLVVEHAGSQLTGVTASFGVSSFPGDGGDAQTLLQAADAALYRAKTGGRNRIASAPPLMRR